MQEPKKTQKNADYHPSPYTYYILCKKCHAVNVPASKGYCDSCSKKMNIRPHDNYRPPVTSCLQTKRSAYKCGGLPWIYRGNRDDHEMCFLSYNGYFISVQRQIDRKFCYIVGTKKETVLRQNITELTFARTRAVRHLAKLMNTTFDDLCDQICNKGAKNNQKRKEK